jgi:hypothetical protein
MWLNKLIHHVKHIVAPTVAPPLASSEETASVKDTKPADMSFYVKQLNDLLYEVYLKDFPASKGRGTNPEQALADLLQSINQQIDSVVKQTLLINMHKEEIREKYTTLIEHFYKNNSRDKKKSWSDRLKNKVFPPRKVIQVLEVNISLKEPDVTQSIMDRLIPKEIPSANLSRLSMLPSLLTRSEQRGSGPNIPELEHRFLLRSGMDNTEPPLNLVFDPEGFEIEEAFTFGIVVNLN